MSTTSESPRCRIREPWNLKVTNHAINQYKVRTSNGRLADHRCANNIRQAVANGKEMVMKSPTLELKQMLAHGCKKARYFKGDGMMVVIEDDSVVVTVHFGTADRWKEFE